MSPRLLLILAFSWAAPAGAQEDEPGRLLDQARALRDEQRYREALEVLEPLAGREDVPARARLEILRTLALVRLILRDDQGGRRALSIALSRDPLFDLGPGNHPPRFLQALEDARATVATVTVRLEAPTVTFTGGRASFEVRASDWASTIDGVTLHVRIGRVETFSPIALEGDPWLGSSPAPGPVSYWLEAKAPSGAVLVTLGSAEHPLVAEPPPPVDVRVSAPPVEPVPVLPPPSRRRHRPRRAASGGGVPLWVWIAGGAAIAAGGATLGVVLAQPDETAREGTWGSAELGR